MVIRNLLKISLMFACNITAIILGKKNKPAVLMYHSFDETKWRYGVDRKQLIKQIAYMVANKNLVSLAEIVSFAEGKNNLPNHSVAITIDDGYLDTYTFFWPLALKYKIPFTLFLTTDLLMKPNLGNLPRPTWEQLQEMADSKLVTFGLHGHSHMSFIEVLKNDCEQTEILDSINLLEDNLDVTVETAAYPSGRYNDEVVNFLKTNTKIAVAFSTHSGFITRGDNLFSLKRVEVRYGMTFTLFKMRLSRGLDLYNKIVWQVKNTYVEKN